MKHIWVTTAGVALLIGWFSAPEARGGACPGSGMELFIEVAAGRVIPLRIPTPIRYGLDRITVGGWPNCRRQRSAVQTSVELDLSPSLRGPFKRVAGGEGRTAMLAPPGPGLWWLRARVHAPDAGEFVAVRAVLVADGQTLLAGLTARHIRARLWSVDDDPAIQIDLRPVDGKAALPRAAAFWRLSTATGDAWVLVSEEGDVRLTPTPAACRIRIGQILAGGWRVSVHHPGVPPLEWICSADDSTCDLTLQPLPSGRVTLRIRPASAKSEGQPLDLVLAPRRTLTVELSAMHLLTRQVQPAMGPFALQDLPGLPGRRDDRDCVEARPFDSPDGPAALGKALCRLQRGAWASWIGVPNVLRRGTRVTAPTDAGGYILWAESGSQVHVHSPVLLFLAKTGSIAVEQVLIEPHCRADGVTAGVGDGELSALVFGRCGSSPETGFLALRDRRGWKTQRLKRPLLAALVDSQHLLALDESGLLRCAPTCHQVASAPEPLLTLQVRHTGPPSAIARSGAVYEIGPRRFQRVLPAPGFNIPLSQLLRTKSGLVGLFGPVIVGSEYHPFCVRSLVAALTPDGWLPVHRVEGEVSPRGSGLDCQSDDTRPAVVIEIAGAGDRLYGRRRSRLRGVLPGFTLLDSR